MDVFISHSAADSKLATRLGRSLEKRGLSVWLDTEKLEAGSNWQREVKNAVHSAKNVLLLIDRYRQPDPAQEFTWRASLEAAWQDPKKRLIPILRRGAKVPKFVLSGSSGGEIQGIRLDDARNLRSAADLIVKIANGRPGATPPGAGKEKAARQDNRDVSRSGSRAGRSSKKESYSALDLSYELPIELLRDYPERDDDPVVPSDDFPVLGGYSAAADGPVPFFIDSEDDDERSERLAEIERAVTKLE